MVHEVVVDRTLFEAVYAQAVEDVVSELAADADIGPEDGTARGAGRIREMLPTHRWRAGHAAGRGALVRHSGQRRRRRVTDQQLLDLAAAADDVADRVGAGLEALWDALKEAEEAGDEDTAYDIATGKGELGPKEQLLARVPPAGAAQADTGGRERNEERRLERKARETADWITGTDGLHVAKSTAQETALRQAATHAQAGLKAIRLAGTEAKRQTAAQAAHAALDSITVGGGPRLARTNGQALHVDAQTGRLYIGVAPHVAAVRFRATNPATGTGLIEEESPQGQEHWNVGTIEVEADRTRVRATWKEDREHPAEVGTYPVRIGLRNDSAPSRYTVEVRVNDSAPRFAQATLPARTKRERDVIEAGGRRPLRFAEAREGNGTLTYTVDGAPSWLDFDPMTRTLTGTVPAGTAGRIFDIVCTATDADGDEAEQLLRLTIRAGTGGG